MSITIWSIAILTGIIAYLYLKAPIIQDVSKLTSVLIVIAHPDDECMFFSPTIIQLVKQHIPVFILCLSSGMYLFVMGAW
jgi:hypothetical protein